MKKEVVVSDISGEELSEYIEISIEKPGHMIKVKNEGYTNRLIMHIKESELSEVLKHIKFEKIKKPMVI